MSSFVGDTAILSSFDIERGNREDVLDIITNISPMDTLMLSNFEKVPASNTTHEWLVDILADFGDPDVGNADVMAGGGGLGAPFGPFVPRKRLFQPPHILPP